MATAENVALLAAEHVRKLDEAARALEGMRGVVVNLDALDDAVIAAVQDTLLARGGKGLRLPMRTQDLVLEVVKIQIHGVQVEVCRHRQPTDSEREGHATVDVLCETEAMIASVRKRIFGNNITPERAAKLAEGEALIAELREARKQRP